VRLKSEALRRFWNLEPRAAPRTSRRLRPHLSQLRRALTPRGTLAIVGAEDAGNWLGVRRQLRATALSPFVRQKLGTFISKERGERRASTREDRDHRLTRLDARAIPSTFRPRDRSLLDCGSFGRRLAQ
jgi:hypothetical protein